jgi:hypothetical protein
MEFDKSRVYTALNADELKVGSSIIAADNLSVLRRSVENNANVVLLQGINPDNYEARFSANNFSWNLAYLVQEPEEKKLKWTDFVIGDIITDGKTVAMVTQIYERDDEDMHIYAGAWWISDKELADDWEKLDR